MINVPHFIKEALDYNNGNNSYAVFLREYYRSLIRKADLHKKVVQTNRDDGFITIHKNMNSKGKLNS